MIKPKRLPVVREDRIIEIPLTKGYVAFVDWEDAWVVGRNWTALETPSGHVYAACGRLLLHRLVACAPDDRRFDVDHKNGDTLNCRRENLRVVTHQANCQNRKPNSNNTSGHTGVKRSKTGRFEARLGKLHLGTFDTPDEANAARLEAERLAWGIHPQRAFAHGVDVVKGAPLDKTKRFLKPDSVRRLFAKYEIRDLI